MSFVCTYNGCKKSYHKQSRLMKHWKKKHPRHFQEVFQAAGLAVVPSQPSMVHFPIQQAEPPSNPPPPPPPPPTPTLRAPVALQRWSRVFIEKYRMYSACLTSEHFVALTQGVAAGNQESIEAYAALKACVPQDFFVTKNLHPSSDERYLKEHARIILVDLGKFQPGELTDAFIDEYIQDTKIFKRELGKLIRGAIKDALLDLLLTTPTCEQYKITKYSDIKRLCTCNWDFFKIVSDFLHHDIYSNFTRVGAYNKGDFEFQILEMCNMVYRRRTHQRAVPYTTSIRKYISTCTEVVRHPLRKLSKNCEVTEMWEFVVSDDILLLFISNTSCQIIILTLPCTHFVLSAHH